MEGQHLVRAHPAREPEELGEVTEGAARSHGAGSCAGALDRPARRANETAGDLHERRLPGAVRAEEPDELSRLDLEVDSGERLDSPVALLEAAGGEHGRHAASVAAGT